ncbi:MAG: glycosyltransferase [Actinobacteria bacterium]|nr:MAG: glycosyltransferase [Actinomycetota bacterium]
MPDAPPRFSLVIATRGRPKVLGETLASAARCDPRPSEVIVVDGDGSGSAEPVARAAGARYRRSAPGLTVQRNAGLDLAQGDVVVFVDDDTELHPRLFAALADAYRDPDVLGVTGPVVDRDLRRFGNMRSRWRRLLPGGGREGSLTRYGYPRRVQDETRERDVEYMLGGLMTARRDAALQVRFDERLADYGLLEDEDFSYRLSRLGRIRFAPSASVVHRNVGAARKREREFNRMVVVNRAYLFRKNFRRTPLARFQFALLVAVLLVHRALNGEWSGVRGLLEGSVEAWRARP